MKNYDQFHDGSFEGLWINGKTVHLFLASEGLQRFVLVAEGISALSANGFKSGNIIFEVVTRSSEEVTLQDIQTLYELQTGSPGEIQAANLLEKVRLEKLELLEINPSYGANCLALGRSVELLTRDAWASRFLLSTVRS